MTASVPTSRRARARQLRHWSFLITIPVVVALVLTLGAEAGLVAALAEVAVIVLALLVARLSGGARAEAAADLFMHPAGRRLMGAEVRLLWTLVEVPARRLRSARGGGGATEFSYHRGSSELGLALALIPVVVAEVVAIELLLPQSWFWPKLAIVALSVYGVLALLAFAVGLRTYPHVLADDALIVRLGRLYLAEVPRDSIALASVDPERADTRTRLVVRDDAARLMVDGETNVRLRLASPVTVQRPLGAPVQVIELAIRADQPASLVRALEPSAPSLPRRDEPQAVSR